MNFTGDLRKYHPADAIMFLSQLNLNGIFTIANHQPLMTLSFDNGCIVDAHSKKGDAKLLQRLIFTRKVNAQQVKRIQQIQAETGLPLRAILAQIDLFPLASVKELLVATIQEVLLELFLMDQGAFHFTDAQVEADDADTRLETRSLALSIAARSDDYHDFVAAVGAMDRKIRDAASDLGGADGAIEEQMVLRLCKKGRTLAQVFEKAPFDSVTVMTTLRRAIDQGTITLAQGDGAGRPISSKADSLFAAFRQALKKLMRTDDSLQQIEALVTFCKGWYDDLMILTAKAGQVVHCKRIYRNNGQGLQQKSTSGSLGALDQEPILDAVYRSGVGFFGSRFPSRLLDTLAGRRPAGECALIPVASKGEVAVFIYSSAPKGEADLSPQQYLELLSWMVAPRQTTAAVPPSPAQLIARIQELPPLPTLVTRVLELLSDPEVDQQKVEKMIGKDQSLVSKLIKISNSALYGGLQRVESLGPALTRLGTRTVRSLVLTASVQSYFFRDNPGMQNWGALLWQHAAECGLAARHIAVATGYADPEKAYVGGVLHDIGKLILLLVSPEQYAQAQQMAKRKAMCDHQAEQEIFATDHMEVGQLLMERWKMPASARTCTRFHHHVDQAEEDGQLAAIVAYANHLSHLHGTQIPWFATDPDETAAQMASGLGLSAPINDQLVETVLGDFQLSGEF